MMSMESVDLKLHLQSGTLSKFRVDNLIIEPYTMNEIKEYGYSKYMENLQWLMITIDDFINSVVDVEKKMMLMAEKSNLKIFDFYTVLGGNEFLEGLMTALTMVFKTDDIHYLKGEGIIVINFEKYGVIVFDEDGNMDFNKEALSALDEEDVQIVHRENYDDLIKAIKIINYLEKLEGKKLDESNPADDETKQLMEHMKKLNEKVEKIKKAQRMDEDEDDSFDLSDIVSAVTAKSNSMNKLNIWNHTLYQVYDEYARLELIDNYEFSVKALMAGADKIDLKHWSSRL